RSRYRTGTPDCAGANSCGEAGDRAGRYSGPDPDRKHECRVERARSECSAACGYHAAGRGRSVKLSAIKRFLPALILVSLFFAPGFHAVAQQAQPSSVGRMSTPEAQSPAKNQQEEDENDAYRHSATVRALGAKLGMNAEQAATAITALNFIVLA